MDKCYNKGCDDHSDEEKNGCGNNTDYLSIICSKYLPKDKFTIAALQAELKLYKRALDLACDKLNSAIMDNMQVPCNWYRDDYDDKECPLTCEDNVRTCIKDYFITKAKEGK